MLRIVTALVVLSAAALVPNLAVSGWDRDCPIPRDVPSPWQAAWSPIVGWRYPCHRVMRDFAPPACWRTYAVTTAFGVELHRDFICR